MTSDPQIFGGKPIIRGRRLGAEHVLVMLAAGGTNQAVLDAYPWLDAEDIQACLVLARCALSHERFDPPIPDTAV
ncbi:MAG: DUF433 domain-containing protein [Planctomycetota bacterium]|nr:DUF433 domain-containing protein [Planctomycetota bacterium]